MKGNRISCAARSTTTAMTPHTERNTMRALFRGRVMRISVIPCSLGSQPRAPPWDVGEEGVEMAQGRTEVLRHHAHVGDDGHEIGVAVPTRHDVHVEVLADARACRLAEVDPDV